MIPSCVRLFVWKYYGLNWFLGGEFLHVFVFVHGENLGKTNPF